ncbi:hypothetical protein PR261_03365 [Metamycoplasma hyosynoviae]|uniref:hypothetical protein n=1 Tax=Metamycoplasma hyosynoviae TaxID=29559 RepID=UPI002358A729|nr:hypothetical protein [Metamycoplasma hyosynoviae]MDC8918069.1 hypothetical protein [Metamycoplasma hyosynoviae]
MYFTEKNEKYYIVDNPFDYVDQLSQIELTGITNVTIEVKGAQSKPNTWSDYWVGQYWKNNQVNGIENQLKIKWGN